MLSYEIFWAYSKPLCRNVIYTPKIIIRAVVSSDAFYRTTDGRFCRSVDVGHLWCPIHIQTATYPVPEAIGEMCSPIWGSGQLVVGSKRPSIDLHKALHHFGSSSEIDDLACCLGAAAHGMRCKRCAPTLVVFPFLRTLIPPELVWPSLCHGKRIRIGG